ncbi:MULTISPECIES: macrolide-inactivating glycosyltransferase [unclassified Streptomyces]|uniref:macrolide-inactivating glycosyltransferase n=1 Tax=unclassified Streptomyces TaxID=2593676 RepID=UPI002E76ACF6|nr:macrolide-inactivating glycosyltransferase [Streptomyces sp. JV176]MEE1797732.1 macrolide-inactivating glycosyltransferase [Streptomyces sp. JV176]
MTAAKPAHIAMFSIAAHGHVNPSLDVIRELVDRGHRVSYAIPRNFVEKVAATGATPVIYSSVLPTPEDDPEEWGTELIDNLEPFLDDAIQALPQLVDAFEDDRPDLVLGDTTSYPAPVLAHRWGVPFFQISTHMVAWNGYREEVAEPMIAELEKSERGRAYRARFAQWLVDQHMDHTDPDRLAAEPGRSLVLIPKALQHRADEVDESVFTFVGACQGDRADQGEWHRPAGAEKVLLVSLGSSFTKQPAFYRACVEAFGGDPGWHVVLQIGKNVEVSELGEIPANIEVRDWVPQLSVLRQADAFITHAGAGGSQEGMATATPMVAVPQAVDQFGNADIMVGLGVARRIDTAEATPEALREAVLALTSDPEVARRLTGIQAGMAAEGGTRQAADLIEAALAADAAR